jgi:hypothetical protein
MTLLIIALLLAAAYLAVGVFFAGIFLVFGVGRVDESAQGTSWITRALWFPGITALWPVFAVKWRNTIKRS